MVCSAPLKVPRNPIIKLLLILLVIGASRVESDLSVVFGLKKDALGNYVAEGSMSVGEAELIYGATQREINLIVNNLLETNPGLA